MTCSTHGTSGICRPAYGGCVVDGAPVPYVVRLRRALERRLPEQEAAIVDLYLLLALTYGTATSRSDVHDAWQVWRSRTRPDHPDLVHFSKLARGVEHADTRFRDAIVEACHEVGSRWPL